ncbi:unnamed protein product [Schistosoma margrebowiei]|uniref:Uncharacterized protein n=1 Tax=Schistosoma margrebowiei TaxID=48269 RepID=A0A183MSH8_9TREM|nr:unnamed protein product [Schistosoma margrebowiei]
MQKPKSSFQEIKTARINYESVNELDFQLVKISNTLHSWRDELHSWGRLSSCLFNSVFYFRGNIENDPTTSCKTVNRGEHRYSKSLPCGKFHLRNSLVFRHAKCFECGKMAQIKSVCRATVRFTTSEVSVLGTKTTHTRMLQIANRR